MAAFADFQLPLAGRGEAFFSPLDTASSSCALISWATRGDRGAGDMECGDMLLGDMVLGDVAALLLP